MARVRQLSPLEKRRAARASRARYISPCVVVPQCFIRWSDYMYTAPSASPRPPSRIRESSEASDYHPTACRLNEQAPNSSSQSSDSDFSPARNTRAVILSRHSTAPIIIASEQLCMKKKSTTHNWTYLERQSLCILKRNFAIGYNDIAQILNVLYPCLRKFGTVMLTSQYMAMKSDPRAPAATKEAYASVWSYDFKEFQNAFNFRIAQVQVKAAELGFDLHSRQSDDPNELCAAMKKRACEPLLFKSAVSNSREDRECTPASLIDEDENFVKDEVAPSESTPLEVFHAMGTELESLPHALPPQQDTIEQSLPRLPVSESSKTDSPFEPKDIPALLFRYVGQRTVGLNGDIIRAGRWAFTLHCPPPPTPDSEQILYDSLLHLSRQPVATSLISTSSSLIWNFAMSYSSHNKDDESRRIYLIDGFSAHRNTCLYSAASLLNELRKRGMFRAEEIRRAEDNTSTLSKTHYKGRYEVLIHAEISEESILGVVPVAKIKELADAHGSVKLFLRLEYFHGMRSTKMIFKKMAKDKMTFDATVGDAIARLMVLFGVTREMDETLSCALFKQFSEGWCLQIPRSSAAFETAASSFASTFVSVTEDSSDPIATYHRMVNMVKQAI